MTKAAELLYITQPAVSHSLARLRELYDDPLFVRTSTGMQPTIAAREISLDVQQALKSIRHSLIKAKGFDAGSSIRHFRLAMSELIESAIMSILLRDILENAPNITLEVYQGLPADMAKELQSGHLDLAIDFYLPGHQQLRHKPFFEDRYICAVQKNHSTISKSISLEQYLAGRHIHNRDRRDGFELIDSTLRALGHERRIIYQTEHVLEAPLLATESELIYTGPESLASRFNLNILELPFVMETYQSCLYYSAEGESDPSLQWLMESLFQIVGNQNKLRVA